MPCTTDSNHTVWLAACFGSIHVHTLRVARTFSLHFFLAWLTDIAYTHGSRCLRCARHISPSHLLPSHVSSTVFAVPARSLRHLVPVCTFPRRTVPDPKSAGQAHFRTSGEEFCYLADPTHSTGYEPKEFDRLVLQTETRLYNDPNYDNISDFSKKHTREHWTVRCSHNV